MKRTRAEERSFEGLGVSVGIAVGPAFLRDSGQLPVVEYQIPKARVAEERQRLDRAIAKAERQLEKLKVKALDIHGAAAEELGFLLEAHQQMLKSRRLIGGLHRRIAEMQVNAETAVMQEIGAIEAEFAGFADPYLSTRGVEVHEVGQRLLRALSNRALASFADLPPGTIVIAEEVTPADTALMDPKRVAGFATVLGGAEGHTAIMARSLGLPAVLGVAGLLAGIKPGEIVIVDGGRGRIIVNPTRRTLTLYQRERLARSKAQQALTRLVDVPAITLDGQRVQLLANLELPRDLPAALKAGAEGVGLLRTEFLFMNRSDLPGEEEQAAALTEIVAGMEGRPVTIRTLDVGGEKIASALGSLQPEGANPALGLRAIRLSLREPALLEMQLAAILRASAKGPVRILLPMISDPGEIVAVREARDRVAGRLQRQKVAIADPLPPVGAMIEVPGAALAADALAQVADFFALGTNDLTMYTLAIDRAEERVAHLYNPLHPAVLRLVQFTVEAALRARIPISLCGEMAGDPRFTALFVGLGLRELSMAPPVLPEVKERLLALDARAAARRAQAVMDQVDSAAIARLIDEFNANLKL